MFPGWGTKDSSLLGVDIGSSNVRVLELEQKGTSFVVKGYGVAPIPAGSIEGKVVKNTEQVVAAIHDAISLVGSKCKTAAIAVPDSTVISKVVQLEDSLSDDEVEELVILEADKYIPYPIDEVSIDFQYLGASERGGSLQDVLVVASRTENVSSRVELLGTAGLDVNIVDVESYALERTISLFFEEIGETPEDKTVAFFDIGDVFTQLTVIHNLQTIFSREEVFGGKQLTDELVKRYDLTLDEAKQAKRSGSLPDDYMTEVLEPYREMIVLQVRRALQFFFSTSQQANIDLILLAGGSSLIPELAVKISEAVDVPAMLVDPISKMSVKKGIDLERISRDSPSLLIACGLAMRKFEQ